MSLDGLKTKMALLVLLLPAGAAAYWGGYHAWGRHHFQAAQGALARRDFQQAEIHLNKCLDAWPRDPSIRILAAQTARRRGDLDLAKRHLEQHARQTEQTDERSLEYQLLFIQQGDLTGADRLLDRTLKNPDASDAYLILEALIDAKVKMLANAYRAGITLVEGPAGEERARTELAIEVWRQRRTGAADQAQALVWRGKIQLLIDPRQASVDFRQALELTPHHFDARLHLAISLAEADPQEAFGHLMILRRREPQNLQVGVNLASALRGLGQIDEAVEILDSLLKTNPDQGHLLLERGKAALDANRPEEGEHFLRRALARTPDEPLVHLALSRCLHLLAKGEEANYHQRKYSEIETERTRLRRLREEEARIAWRKRVEGNSDR